MTLAYMPWSEPRVQRLWLVRHGLTAWNSERRLCGEQDIPLATEGVQQGIWVGQQLSTVPLAAIYTSPLLRAAQTAEYILQQRAMPVPVITIPAWREMSFGAWEGLTYAQVAQEFPAESAFFTDPVHYTPPQGEPFLSLVQRVQGAFEQLVCADTGDMAGDLVLVSHGGPLRALLCWLLALPFTQQWRLPMAHGSLSALDFVQGASDIVATVTLDLLNLHAGVFQRTTQKVL